MSVARTLQLALSIVTVAALCAFSAARPATDVICRDWLPNLTSELDAIAPARSLASTANFDREKWITLSEKMLRSSQAALDLLEGQSEHLDARKEFSSIATRWVELRGYAERGQADRIRATLKAIESSATRVRRLACH